MSTLSTSLLPQEAERTDHAPLEDFLEEPATLFFNPVFLVVAVLVVLLAAWALIWLPVAYSTG